jgi:starch synthase (maltosyl-transferring)
MSARSSKREAAPTSPSRVVIENLRPRVDDGRYAVKRTVGEMLEVKADVHADGHDELRVVLLHRAASQAEWLERPMQALGNDVWEARIRIERLEPHHYTVVAWAEPFRSWRRDLGKRVAAAQLAEVDLLVGAELVSAAGQRARGADAKFLQASAAALRDPRLDLAQRAERAIEASLLSVMDRYPDRSRAARCEPPLVVDVDRERALCGAWYEFFPRSCGNSADRPGRLRDCEERLSYAASMGFDVVYLPPIHPIGRSHRKGPNNNPVAAPGDLGSPWAIGAKEGGHTAIHPELGTLEDFRWLLARAKALGLEVAMDLAFQCAPDHPWVEEHPEWFLQRPDGTVQYAENPPKKYQDIYPIHFECDDWKALWEALRGVVEFWLNEGVRIFRVDNPHTKPYPFWEWLIGEVRREHPDTIFLAEAFTRPKVMARLARVGFNQSYTYFAWRNTRSELTEYLTSLNESELAEYMRPNFWPNTPDILPEFLQYGGRPGFALRFLLASTLSASYGIYGPAFELCEARAVKPGGEEYLDSEKYQLRDWDVESADSLKELIARVNRVRNDNPALRQNRRLRFHTADNEQLLVFSKWSEDKENVVIVVVNLDPHHVQSGWVKLPLAELGLPEEGAFQVHDLISEARYFWSGARNFLELDPQVQPGHIFRVRRRVRSEQDFDYYL